MSRHDWLVFDIETCGIDDAADYLEPIEAPANYKDPEKIAAYKVERQAQLIARAALDCDLNRIVAIGLRRQTHPTIVLLAQEEADERNALSAFWDSWSTVTGPKINFNGLYFDLPVLLRRSQLLGVHAPQVSLDRFRSPIVDLLQVLTWNGAVKEKPLDVYCKRFDIPCHETIDAKDIPVLAAARKGWSLIRDHCQDDVDKTTALAARLGLIALDVPESVETL